MMNWGNKILLVYAVFVLGITFMVYRSSAKKIDLVTPDYYEQELKYQVVIDAAQRTNHLTGKTVCQIKGDSLLVILPKEMIGKKAKGTLLLYCIADKDKDVSMDWDTQDALVRLKPSRLSSGVYEVKLNWTANDLAYYYEEKILLR